MAYGGGNRFRLAKTRTDVTEVRLLPWKTHRETRLVAYRAASDIAGKGAFLIITVLAARRLTPEAFGAFALGSAAGWMAAVVSDAGIQMHLARSVARNPGDADRILRQWAIPRLLLSAGAATVIGAVALAGLLPHPLAVTLFALVYLLSGLIEFLHHFYRGLGRSNIESSLVLALRAGSLVVAIAALTWSPDPVVLAMALLAPTAAVLAVSTAIARRLPRAASVVEGQAVRETTPRRFWSDVAPIGIGIALSALYFRVDVFLLETWSGTETVAVYAAVFRLVEALRLVPAAVLAIALPAMCRARGPYPLVPLASGLTAFGVLTAAIGWPLATWIVCLLYGSAYADGVPAFQVLLLAFPLMSLNYALTQQLIGWNRHLAFAVLCAVALVANVVVNARLIPEMGTVGAAWATVITEMVLTGGCAFALFAGSRGLERTADANPASVSLIDTWRPPSVEQS